MTSGNLFSTGNVTYSVNFTGCVVTLIRTVIPDGTNYLQSVTQYHNLTYPVNVCDVVVDHAVSVVEIHLDNDCDDLYSFGEIESFFVANEPEEDIVNHPSHYQSNQGIEVIQVIGAFTEDLVGMEAVCTANVLKYVCRWKKKNGIEDLKKAEWYLKKLIDIKEAESK